MDRERFGRGLSYDAYKAQMTRNRDKLEATEAAVRLAADDLAAFRARSGPLHVVALAEDWCGDVIANLPVLGVLARESGTIDLRVFLRDQNKDLMARWLNQGKYESIPVFAFFDDQFTEIGVFTERPATVTAERRSRREAIHAADPAFGAPDAPIDQLPDDVRARLSAAIAKMREEMVPWANAEVVKELRAIAERAPAAA
ncbi:MAG TPA: thioredoxin family protein [Candidatus Saccharimonadales bacterium]|nr:thioredoxin family protein [Candidatus Saccharimonadales bacterium]